MQQRRFCKQNDDIDDAIALTNDFFHFDNDTTSSSREVDFSRHFSFFMKNYHICSEDSQPTLEVQRT